MTTTPPKQGRPGIIDWLVKCHDKHAGTELNFLQVNDILTWGRMLETECDTLKQLHKEFEETTDVLLKEKDAERDTLKAEIAATPLREWQNANQELSNAIERQNAEIARLKGHIESLKAEHLRRFDIFRGISEELSAWQARAEKAEAEIPKAFKAARATNYPMRINTWPYGDALKYPTFADYQKSREGKGSWVTKSSDELAKELGVEKRATYKSMRGDE